MPDSPEERLRQKWPALLAAMLELAGIDIEQLIEDKGLYARLRDDRETNKVFTQIFPEQLALLGSQETLPPMDRIMQFLNAIWRFSERNMLKPPFCDADTQYAQSVYSLAYLAKTEDVARLLLEVYVPLLRPGLWDKTWRSAIVSAFNEDVHHLLYELEHLYDAGDHGVFDWYGNLNGLDEYDRLEMLDYADLPALAHPAFPPQEVWRWHTNLMPAADEFYLGALRELYEEMGYTIEDEEDAEHEDACDNDPKRVALLDGDALTRVLRRMKEVPGRRTGCAFWRFTDCMVIEWSGMEETLPAQIFAPVPEGLMVSCQFMQHAGDQHTYSGEVTIGWTDDHMYIDNHRVPAERSRGPRVFDLPFDASQADVLRASLAHSASDVRQSGYSVESEQVAEKWVKSILKAEKALAWAGLDCSRLTDVLTEAVLADARKHRSPPDEQDAPAPPAPSPPGPRWEYPSGEDHVDLIAAGGAGLIYMYVWDQLDHVGLGNYELRQMIVRTLDALSRQNKKLRHRAFTVFGGDMWPDFSRYGIGLTATDGNLARFLDGHWRQERMSGPREGDLSSLEPLFRYDHGRIIMYAKSGVAGTNHVDGEEGWDTGVRLYVRGYVRKGKRARYAKLVAE